VEQGGGGLSKAEAGEKLQATAAEGVAVAAKFLRPEAAANALWYASGGFLHRHGWWQR
jgi:hypothetical protein